MAEKTEEEEYNAYLEKRAKEISTLTEYAQGRFPDENLKLLSEEGSSCLVFDDETGETVYKVIRNNNRVDYVENEAAILTLLGPLGLSPRLHSYVQPFSELHTTSTYDVGFGLKDANVPVHEKPDQLPVLVMDKIDFEEEWRDTIPDEQFIEEMERIADALRKFKMVPNDVEVVYDKKAKHLVFLDVAGMTRFSLSHVYPDLIPRYSEDELYEGELYRSLVMRLARHQSNFAAPNGEGISVEKCVEAIRAGNKKYMYDMVLKRTPRVPEEDASTTDHTPLALGTIRKILGFFRGGKK